MYCRREGTAIKEEIYRYRQIHFETCISAELQRDSGRTEHICKNGEKTHE